MKSVKVQTKYSENVLKSFLKFHYKKFSLILLVCGLVCVLMGAILAFLSSPVTGIVTAVMGVFFAFYPKLMIAISLNANKRMVNAEDDYEFMEDSVKIVSTILGEEVTNQVVKYVVLEKLIEDEQYIYIYTNKISSILVEKSKLQTGEYEFIVTNVNKGIAKRLAK